jgi:hypothetical protein
MRVVERLGSRNLSKGSAAGVAVRKRLRMSLPPRCCQSLTQFALEGLRRLPALRRN